MFFLPSSLFFISLIGIILNRKNLLFILFSFELTLLSLSLFFILISLSLDDIIGQYFALFILTVAASESSIGLALFVIFFHIKGSISLKYLNLLNT